MYIITSPFIFTLLLFQITTNIDIIILIQLHLDEIMKKILIIIGIVIVLGIGTLLVLPDYLSNTKNTEDVEIVIEEGDNLSTVAEKLYEKEIIPSRYWFRFKGSDVAVNLKPGSYIIPSDVHIDKIYDIIQEGEEEEYISITFPEGFILYQFAERVEGAGIGTSEDFIEATDRYFQDHSYEFDTSDHYFNMEGYLFPDTYYFDHDQTIDEVVQTLIGTMDDVFSEEYMDRMEELNLSKHQVLTIASLIEREAYNDEERETISGVIYNRLDTDMPLQIDATVIYGKGEGREHTTRVLYSDLEEDNPYNTYRNSGMPPGPIASPSINSIHAALYPEEHEYLYYVLGEDGHVFARTYDEHLENVDEYRQDG